MKTIEVVRSIIIL